MFTFSMNIVHMMFTAGIFQQDIYACELFQILGKRREISSLIVTYMRLRQELGQSVLVEYESSLPYMATQVEKSLCSPVYGIPLEEHLKITRQVGPCFSSGLLS